MNVWFQQFGPSDWFQSSNNVDAILSAQFADELARQSAFPAAHVLDNPQTARAAILLFNQVARNVHRGTPRAFATDPLALEIAKAVIAAGWDEALPDGAR